ncbi:MAG TPA: hypothetical protein VFV52_10995 [Bacilli bacterium]|nr:hypothetical protein [Bacilli bacterium]
MKKKKLRYTEACDPDRPLPDIPSGFVVPPDNPPGFGTVERRERYESPLVTGTTLFDDPFYNVLSPPPFAEFDPTWPEYRKVLEAAANRIEKCPEDADTRECRLARTAYFDAARDYAIALDKHWGQQRFQNGEGGIPSDMVSPNNSSNKKRRKRKKST